MQDFILKKWCYFDTMTFINNSKLKSSLSFMIIGTPCFLNKRFTTLLLLLKMEISTFLNRLDFLRIDEWEINIIYQQILSLRVHTGSGVNKGGYRGYLPPP